MILLSHEDAWPTDTAQGTAPADMRKEPRPLTHVIGEGVSRFMQIGAAGLEKPNLILMGWNAKRALMREVDSLRASNLLFKEPSEKTIYHGMRVVFMNQNGLELLRE